MKIKKLLCLLIAAAVLCGTGAPVIDAFAKETGTTDGPDPVAVEEESTTAAEEETTTAVEETTAGTGTQTAATPETEGAAAEKAPAEEETTAVGEVKKPRVTFAPGDVSGDDGVNAEDARIALRIAVGLEAYDENAPQTKAADVDGSSGVTASDARLILRAAVGLNVFSQGKDHVHVFEKEVVEPTCTEGGYTLLKCLFCNESTKDEFTAPRHRYYKFYCTVCGQMNPLHQKTAFVNDFERTLYDHSHPLWYKTADQLSNTKGVGSGSLLEYVYHSVGKWCCYYTIHDVFRPALKKAGYSDEKIEQIAPIYYTADKIEKVLRNSTELYVPAAFMGTVIPMYVPSMLLDYYIYHPEYAKTYIFKEYYDDMVEQRLYQPTANRTEYKPRVGDVVFMSNKLSTYVNGYPTVDHTAQIIMMYDDGSFWCTEGSIIQNSDVEQDNKPRVRERVYFFNNESGTYEYFYNPVVVVLAIAQPDLYDDFKLD